MDNALVTRTQSLECVCTIEPLGTFLFFFIFFCLTSTLSIAEGVELNNTTDGTLKSYQ